MSTQRFVLVPLDASEAANAALPAARSIAKAGHAAEIALLHVVQGNLVSEEELRRRLGLSEADTAGCRLLQATGNAAIEICRSANELPAWIIIMSTQGETAARQARFGNTLAAVIGNTDRAVLAIRPDMPEPRRTLRRISCVLLPLDGSPAAATAVHAALDFAHEFGARLKLLHVPVSAKAAPEQPGTLVGPKYIDAPHHEWPRWRDEFVRRFGPGERAGSEFVELHTAPGDPGEQILRFAEEHNADLIGIAWRQKLDPGRAEIVKRLLAESQCPLLFVPAATRESA
jgi:nucleotide-binding universal stress UspA family protein